jgi:predicted nucleic acid-binding protein
MAVIVDASVVVKWFSPEPLSDVARELIERTEPLLAPDLIVAEFASAMWLKARRNQIDPSDASQAIAAVAEQRGLQHHASVPLVQRAYELGLELNHSPYDCIYLALAESLDMLLVTADQRFALVAGREHPRVRLLGQDPL